MSSARNASTGECTRESPHVELFTQSSVKSRTIIVGWRREFIAAQFVAGIQSSETFLSFLRKSLWHTVCYDNPLCGAALKRFPRNYAPIPRHRQRFARNFAPSFVVSHEGLDIESCQVHWRKERCLENGKYLFFTMCTNI